MDKKLVLFFLLTVGLSLFPLSTVMAKDWYNCAQGDADCNDHSGCNCGQLSKVTNNDRNNINKWYCSQRGWTSHGIWWKPGQHYIIWEYDPETKLCGNKIGSGSGYADCQGESRKTPLKSDNQ